MRRGSTGPGLGLGELVSVSLRRCDSFEKSRERCGVHRQSAEARRQPALLLPWSNCPARRFRLNLPSDLCPLKRPYTVRLYMGLPYIHGPSIYGTAVYL